MTAKYLTYYAPTTSFVWSSSPAPVAGPADPLSDWLTCTDSTDVIFWDNFQLASESILKMEDTTDVPSWL